MNRTLRLLPVPPLDVRLMNVLSLLLGVMFAAMVLAVGLAWVMRQSLFNLSAIHVEGDIQHNNAATLRANVTPRLSGNFFMMDLAGARAAFESVPWVRRAVVRREFPDRRVDRHRSLLVGTQRGRGIIAGREQARETGLGAHFGRHEIGQPR